MKTYKQIEQRVEKEIYTIIQDNLVRRIVELGLYNNRRAEKVLDESIQNLNEELKNFVKTHLKQALLDFYEEVTSGEEHVFISKDYMNGYVDRNKQIELKKQHYFKD